MLAGHLIHKSVHPDGDALVIERDGARYLYLGSDAVQSAMDLRSPHTLKLTYTQAMMGFLLFTPKPSRCLLIGLGGGALAKHLLATHSNIIIDVIELREDVISIAHAMFFVPHDKRLTIICDDASHAMPSLQTLYDVILVDAFDQNGISPNVYQHAFLAQCSRLLDPNGSLVINMWAATSHQLKATLEQLRELFACAPLCLPVPERGNIIVFASQRAIPAQPLKQLKKHAVDLESQFDLPFVRYLKEIHQHNLSGWLKKFLHFTPH